MLICGTSNTCKPYNWWTALSIPAFFIILIGAFNGIFLKPEPQYFIPNGLTKRKYTLKEYGTILKKIPKKLLSYTFQWSIIYGFIKLVNYAFFFWLALYLDQSETKGGLGIKAISAVLYSNLYDLGGICGGIVAGFVMNYLPKNRRCPPLLVMLICSIILTICIGNLKHDIDVSIIYTLIFFEGFFIGGPANIISSVIPVDLTENEENETVSFVTGIIDGVASIFAAVGQVLVGLISAYYGWNSVFLMFTICLGLSSVIIVLFPLLREIKNNVNSYTRHTY
jgi:sugar phosphate permease